MFKKYRFWTGLLLSFLFLFFFLFRYHAQFGDMWREIKEANYLFILPAVLVYFVGIGFRALRWKYLMKPLGAFAWHRLFPLVVIGFAINNITPGRLGIVARAYILGEKENVSKMATGATLVVEQIFDSLTLLVFLVIGFLFAPLLQGISMPGQIRTVALLGAIIFVTTLVVLVVIASSDSLRPKARGLLLRLLPRAFRPKASALFDRFVSGLAVLRSPGAMAITFAMSVAVWTCEAAVFYLVSFSFDLGLPFYVFLMATAAGNLAWALVVTPGGLGSFDLATQLILTTFLVTVSKATSYVVLLHALLLLPITALGFLFLWAMNLSFSQVVGSKRAELEVGVQQ